MTISTGALTVARIAAFRSLPEAAEFSGRFVALGFQTFVESSQATCGFWLVHYQYFGIQRPDF